MNFKRISMDGIKEGGLIRGSRIAAAGLLAGAILACGSDTPIPARVTDGGILEKVVAEEVNEPGYNTPTPVMVAEEVQVIPEDEPAYVREELHEELGVPRPQDMTATRLEKKGVEYMTLIHGDDLGSYEIKKLTVGTMVVNSYVKSLGMPEVDVDINLYVYRFPPEVKSGGQDLAKNPSFFRAPCEDYQKEVSDLEIFLNQDTDTSSWHHFFVHELVHAYQQSMTRVDDKYWCPDEPLWIREGSAEFFTVRATADADRRVREYRGTREPEGQRYDQSRAMYSGYVNDFAGHSDASHRSLYEDPYRHGFLGVELLASIAGESSILRFYGSLQPDKPWQESFQKAFGMGIGEFYNRFEKHQANGFPKLDIRKGEPYVQPQNKE